MSVKIKYGYTTVTCEGCDTVINAPFVANEGLIRQNTAQAAVDKAIFDFEITEAGAGDK